MGARLRLCWQKIKQHPFITMGIAVTIFALVVFTLIVSKFGWDWTGFVGGESKVITTITPNGTIIAKEAQSGKSLWDWLGLLSALAIPVVVGFGAAWFSAQQGKVSDRENTDNQREAALQAYIDKMSELLLKERLGELEPEPKEGSPVEQKTEAKTEFEKVQNIARVRTLTVLRRLNGTRKGSVLQFLYEAGLIDKDKAIVVLHGADLSDTYLSNTDLFEIDMSHTNLSHANLSYADLTNANLSHINLSHADLNRAHLDGVNLSGADLSLANLSSVNTFVSSHEVDALVRESPAIEPADLQGANFQGANLFIAHLSKANLQRANFQGANLIGINLQGANLRGANLRGANLSESNLYEAKVSPKQLKQVEYLQGAIMPDGSKHP